MAASVQVNLLGGVRFIVDNNIIENLPARVGQALLIYLLHQPRPVAREQLMDLFFQMNDATRARTNLRATLSRVKKQVGELLAANRAEVWVREGLAVGIDAQQFASALAVDRPQTAAAAVDLSLVLAQYHGDFLAGFHLRDAPEFEQWMLVERERLRLLAIEGYQKLLGMQQALGNFPAALEAANALLAIEPLLEHVHREKLKLLTYTGQRAVALKLFDAVAQLFETELGVGLSAETNTLHAQILTDTLVIPHLEPARSIASNLPTPVTRFVGRTPELEDIAQTLAQPDCQLVTLLGAGGIGKSRLAIAAAAIELAADNPRYQDGIYFVPLAAVRDERTLITAILTKLGVRSGVDKPPLEQLTAYLRERHLLLVLDNFEQLVAHVELLLTLLRSAKGLTLLVTSRVYLDLFEEWIVDVGGMDGDTATELFVGLAQRWNRRFSAETNATHIAKICQLTGGIPLALELAAARTRTQDCATIAAQIAASVDYLATQSPSLPARQRTMRAVFHDSWQLLSATEQQVLAEISVFRGGFSAEAISALFSPPENTIADLIDKSLVQQRADGRFDLHEVVRQYAWEHNATPDATRHSHTAYFLQTIGDIQQSTRDYNRGLAPTWRSLRELYDDIDNVRAAWAWATEQQQWSLLEHAAYGFGQSLIHRELPHEGIARFTQTQAAYASQTHPSLVPLNVQLNLFLGRFNQATGNVTQAVAHLKRSFQQAQQHEEAWLLGLAAGRYGYVLYRQGSYVEARKMAGMAAQISAEASDHGSLSTAYNSIGSIAMAQADWDVAEFALRQALTLNERRNNKSSDCGMAHSNLGYFYNLTKQYDIAAQHLEKCLAIFEKNGSKSGIGYAAINLAGSVIQQGDRARAIELIQLSYTNRRAIDDKRGMMACVSELAGLAIEDGELAQAQTYLLEGLQLGAGSGAQQRFLTLLAYIVQLQTAREDWETSVVLGGYIAGHASVNDITRKLVVPLLEQAVAQLEPVAAAAAKQRALALTDMDAIDLAESALRTS